MNRRFGRFTGVQPVCETIRGGHAAPSNETVSGFALDWLKVSPSATVVGYRQKTTK